MLRRQVYKCVQRTGRVRRESEKYDPPDLCLEMSECGIFASFSPSRVPPFLPPSAKWASFSLLPSFLLFLCSFRFDLQLHRPFPFCSHICYSKCYSKETNCTSFGGRVPKYIDCLRLLTVKLRNLEVVGVHPRHAY
jgi:hypothetical protein